MWKVISIAVIIGLQSSVHGVEINKAKPSKDSRVSDYESREILAGRQVFVYRSYKDVQIFHYNIPSGVVSAYFNFTANDTLACNARNISVFLQAGSYPVINPDGAEYPPLMWTKRSKIYEVQLQSNLKPAFLTVDNPVPGDWYMIAFINDTSNRITQAGLFPSCHSWLMSEVKYKREMSITTIVPEIHSTQEIHLLQKVSQKHYYKFYVPANTWTATVLIDKCEEVDGIDCPIIFGVRARGLPDLEDSSTSVRNCSLALDSVNNMTCELTLIPEEEAWHYILVQAVTEDAQLSIAVKLSMCDSASISSYHLLTKLNLSQLCPSKSKEKENPTNNELVTVDPSPVRRILFPSLPSNKQNSTARCWKRHDLVKKTFAGNFVFEFDQVPDENGTVPLMMNISNSAPTVVSFHVEPIIDIGGTLAYELAILPFMNVSVNNISLVSCLSVGVRSEVNEQGNCSGNGKLLNINTTTLSSAAGAVLVPFPEPGVWYITLLPSCFLTNASESVECLEKETSVLFSIASASCIQGKCGHYGSCYQYISGGFIFSTCVCDAGYQGWGCTDNSQATPDWELLLATLLLTLSNLLFLPVVVLAILRRHYAEAVIYAFTMFFSTFYHACDQEAYNFCLMRLSVMQFCDFYSAILSFWVTLLAMADLPHSLYSLLHMAGAVTVALGVEYNRTGLWVFVIPSASAFVVMVSSWIWHCKKSKTCYPKKKYWLFCLIPGVLLAATGLILYTLLETVDNYPFVHSAWHATMALCITFLLPPKKKDYESMTPEDLDPLPGCEALPEAPELVPNAIHSITTP